MLNKYLRIFSCIIAVKNAPFQVVLAKEKQNDWLHLCSFCCAPQTPVAAYDYLDLGKVGPKYPECKGFARDVFFKRNKTPGHKTIGCITICWLYPRNNRNIGYLFALANNCPTFQTVCIVAPIWSKDSLFGKISDIFAHSKGHESIILCLVLMRNQNGNV